MRRIINYFFIKHHTPATHVISDLQRRAIWIALALILQALNEIDHNYYLPILKQFASLPPLFLLLGSFYALWMAIRPREARSGRDIQNGSTQRGGDDHLAPSPSLWQRIVLFLTLALTIAGTIQIGYTTFICFTPPVFT